MEKTIKSSLLDMSSIPWFSEMMSSIDEEVATQENKVIPKEDSQHPLTFGSSSSYSSIIDPLNNKTTFSFTPIETSQRCFESSRSHTLKAQDYRNSLTTRQYSSSTTKAVSSSPKFVSFGSSNLTKNSQKYYGNLVGLKRPKEETESIEYMTFDPSDVVTSQGSRGSQGVLSTTEHALAERVRREKLSKHFTALSSLVPGLTKMDKASVLGTAIKYLKKLEERAKMLEEKTTKKKMESVAFIKKSKKIVNGWYDEPLPEIEAKVFANNVFIRIHCEKHKGLLVKILAEIENFQLTVVNSSIMPFGRFAVEISVVAQMEMEFNMSVKDFVRNLRSAFRQFM